MKKLYIILSLIIAAVMPSTMSALTINADGGHVRVNLTCYEGTASRPTYMDVTDMLNTGIDILSKLPSSINTEKLHGYIEFNPDHTHIITKSTVGEVTTDHFTPAESQYNIAILSFGENQLDIDMSVTVVSLESMRTASFTLNIDNTAQFHTLYRTFTDGNLLPADGRQSVNIPFIPSKEDNYTLLIMHEFYEGHVYYVKKNGIRVPRLSGQFNFSVKDGDVIDVVTEFPDEMFDVRFVEAEGSEGVLAAAGLGSHPEEKLENLGSFKAKAGTTITPTGNNTDFDNIRYTVDESVYEGDYFRYSRIPVDRNPMTIVVSGDRKPRRQLTVTVDDPSRVIMKSKDYSYTGFYTVIHTLQPGENVMDVADKSNIEITGSATGVISHATVDGEEYNAGAYDEPTVQLYPGIYNDEENGITTPWNYEAVITTAPRERDMHTIIISDSYDGPVKVYTDRYGDPYELPVEDFNGHRLLRLHPSDIGYSESGKTDSPYLILPAEDATQSSRPEITLDNYEMDCEPMSDTQLRYYAGSLWEREDSHAIKIFGNGRPDSHRVTFTTDFEPTQVSITRDHVRPYTLTDTESYFYDYPGTTLHVATPAGIPAEVKVNDTAIAPGEDGRYMFTVEGPTTVSVMRSVTGIDSIGADATDAAPVYYNLQGIRVDRPASGTYIVVRPSGITKETIR
ncbi:MAG: hypothetical protein K1V84_10215 [Muribaculaceae bacterium]